MNAIRDGKGRFARIATPVQAIKQEIEIKKQEIAELESSVNQLIQAENNPPAWLRDLVISIADSLGITPEEFASRVKVIHPTPQDPVLLVDGKPAISWI